MNGCITHYDGPSFYDDPLLVTERRLTTILLAKEEHEKRNDRHIFQYELVPKGNILRYGYHRNPYYSKSTKIIHQKRADSIDKFIQKFNSIKKNKNLNLHPQE